jgi:hypothetical protein
MSEGREQIKETYLKDLYEDFRYSIEKFDSQSLYISSGSLGLSLTFITAVLPIADLQHFWLFYIGIALFVFVIAIGFLSHLRSSKLIAKQIDLVSRHKPLQNDTSIQKLNKVIAGSLVLGIICITFFITLNISNMSKRENPKPQSQEQSDNNLETARYKRALPLKSAPEALASNTDISGNNQSSASTGSSSTDSSGSGNSSQDNKTSNNE